MNIYDMFVDDGLLWLLSSSGLTPVAIPLRQEEQVAMQTNDKSTTATAITTAATINKTD